MTYLHASLFESCHKKFKRVCKLTTKRSKSFIRVVIERENRQMTYDLSVQVWPGIFGKANFISKKQSRRKENIYLEQVQRLHFRIPWEFWSLEKLFGVILKPRLRIFLLKESFMLSLKWWSPIIVTSSWRIFLVWEHWSWRDESQKNSNAITRACIVILSTVTQEQAQFHLCHRRGHWIKIFTPHCCSG